MANTSTGIEKNLFEHPGLREAASTREGYDCICDLFEDFGCVLVEETVLGKTYENPQGVRKFLPYSWIRGQD